MKVIVKSNSTSQIATSSCAHCSPNLKVSNPNFYSEEKIRGIKFRSNDENDDCIYHTDCMMTLFSKHAVVCLDAITDKDEREMVIKELTDPELNVNPKEIIELTFKQSANMCANMFNVLDQNNNHCVVMSKTAYMNHSEENLYILEQNYKVITADIDIIEKIGGGSARCMLVELF